MSKVEIGDLRRRMKELGINSFGMTRVAMEQAIAEATPQARSDTRPTTREETGRSERVPLGTPRSKLSAPKREGFVRRWINDTVARISHAEQAGYQFVANPKDREGGPWFITVGTKEDGTPLTAYLMEIRQEFYDEDQAAKMSQIDEVEAAIKRGQPSGAEAQDQGKFYTPGEGISIT